MNMNNVNIDDQLRESYHPDRWMRKHKWWWSMLFWSHGTILVNDYVAYKRHMEMDVEVPMSHYEFCKAIVLANFYRLGHGAPTQREYFAVSKERPKGHVNNDQEL